MDASNDVQRSLGRIEGQLSQCLEELRSLRVDFAAHKEDDASNFSKGRSLVFEQRDVLSNQIKVITDANERAKGAGWVIIGLLGFFATFAGTALLAVLNGYVKFRLH